jgi:mannose-6-phosphate isomerase-like protein (cupin superfamily)
MTDELIRLSDRQVLRVVRETPEELELEATWDPGGPPPPAHLHPAQDEHFEVRAGELAAVVDGVEHTLSAGDTLDIPRNTPHKMWNASGERAVALWLTRPAGRTAEWFRTMERLGAGGPSPAPPDELIKALNEYSDVFRLVTDS